MKKALVIPLTDEELQHVYRILIDRDPEGAWEFLNAHARAQLLKAMKGSRMVMIRVPGAGMLPPAALH